MKVVYRKFVAALFLSLLVLPFMASYSFAADYDSSSSNEMLTKEVVRPAEDFSLDGLSAEASDGGAPLLGDECKLGLSVSGNSGSLGYKFVWEQGGWARWGTIRKGGSSASCSWVPEVAGDVNIWVDAVDSTGRVTTRKFPVHVEHNLENFDSITIESNGTASAGDSIVITPNLKIRKSQGLIYKYVWMKNAWKDWGVIDSGEGMSSLEWSVKHTGDVSIFVDVVDTNTGQTLTCSKNCYFTPEQWTYASLSSSHSLVKPGDEVSIQANCDGVTGFLSYKFVWSKNNWSKWGVAQSGTSPILSWTPDSPGEYDLYCDVSGSDGKVTSRSVHIGVWGFSGVAAVSTDGNLSWGVRADLGTLDAEKSGQFQFKFVWAKPDWSSWGVLKNGSTENNAYFNPSELGLNPGYYDLYCDVTYPDGSLHTKSTQVYYNPIGSSTVLGVSRISLVTWLMSHQYDSYYLGTRYSSGFSYDTCLYPNGSPRWDGFTGMNCTGFVAHAYAAVGGNVSAIGWNNSHSPWAGGPGGGGYINAWRWYGYACDSGCKMYEFRTVQDMLNSGYAQKGDIIFFKTDGSIDCHIGFFWGDTPYENKMWHQILPGNLIGPCFNNANKGEVRQSVVLIK